MASNEEKREIHVLLVAFSSVGHINPMLRFGKRLALKGLRVTLASTEIARQRFLKSDISTTYLSDTDTKIRLEFFSDGLPLDYDRKANMDHFMDCLGKFGPQNLSNLINHLTDSGLPKFSCFVNNPFVPWVADVASQYNIPCAMLWIQPCALYAIYYRFYNELNSFPTLTDPNTTVLLPGLPLLHRQDLPSFVLPSNPFGSFPKLFSDLFKSMDKVKWVLVNSFYELEREVIESMIGLYPIRPIGPLVPSSLLVDGEHVTEIGVNIWKPEESCIEWLDKQEASSTIYVSFGSLVDLSAKQMENIALGLKSAKRPFLWVVKPPEVATTTGAGELPAGFLEEVEGQGIVVKWCPQTKVLSHPSIACFISHCGWNSTLETVASGVPMICFPQWTDQPANAKLIVDVFQMGVRLEPDGEGVVKKDEVERCINEVIMGPKSEEMKKKAIQWKESARKAVAGGGSSDNNIELFINEIIHECKEKELKNISEVVIDSNPTG